MPRLLTAIVVVLLALAHSAPAQETSAEINKVLDQVVKGGLELSAPMPKAMEQITQKTGIRIQVDPIVYDLLPWGQETFISAKIENRRLREALDLLMQKLGLRAELRGEYLEILPMPALRRLARRSTMQELQALDTLASSPAELGTTELSLKQLLGKVDQRLMDLKTDFAIENRTTDAVDQSKTITVPRNATLMDALEALSNQTRATWYPWGKTIVVTTKEDRVRAQLSRPINARYNGAEVMQVLFDLEQRSGVDFELAPGLAQQIPLEARTLRAGVFENAPILQILDAISASTGLTYTVTDQGVRIASADARAAGPREPIIGMLQLDMGVQVFLRESDVPADVREYIRHKTRQEVEKYRKMMQQEGFKPTTRPATAPAFKDEHL